MQLTELKAFVKSHLSDLEIKAFGYDLRRRESWEALADRCKEYAAAKMQQVTEVTAGYAWAKVAEVVDSFDNVAQYIQDFSQDEAVHLTFTGTAMITRLAKQSIELLVMAGVFCWFFYQELRESGMVQKTLDRMAEIENPPLWQRARSIDFDHDVWGYDAMRDSRLAISVRIAA